MARIGSFSVGFSEYPTNDWALNIYFSGCGHRCVNCQNPSLWDSSYGEEYSVSEAVEAINSHSRSARTDKLVLLGGDPLYGINAEFVNQLIAELSSFHICLYTGYDLSHVTSVLSNLPCLDYVKTGKYIEELSRKSGKNDQTLVLSSSNQEMHKVSVSGLTRISDEGIILLGE